MKINLLMFVILGPAMIRKIAQNILIPLLFSLYACNENTAEKDKPKPLEVQAETRPIHFLRFEQDLNALSDTVKPGDIRRLKDKYGDFFELWCTQLAEIVPPGDTAPKADFIAHNLSQYLGDKYIREVHKECLKKYENLEWLEEATGELAARYEKGFPKRRFPCLVTYFSPFTSNIMTSDTILGVGLHFYLGSNYAYYPSLGMPQYMIRKFRKEYILNDMIKGWLDSEFMDDSSQINCLSQMIYQGKTLYALDVLSPEIDDTIKTGYSDKQLRWVTEHEKDLWAFFIEQKLLYNTNPKVYLKYIHDGNTTSGFPKDAPARLGPFVGWKIVRSYMRAHPEMTLEALFMNKDAQSILTASGYKPQKIKP